MTLAQRIFGHPVEDVWRPRRPRSHDSDGGARQAQLFNPDTIQQRRRR